MHVFLKTSWTYSQTRGAAMRSGSDPPMSRHTVLYSYQNTYILYDYQYYHFHFLFNRPITVELIQVKLGPQRSLFGL